MFSRIQQCARGREKNEYIWRGNRRGGLLGITEFGDENKGEGKGEDRVKRGLIIKEMELGGREETLDD